MFARMFLLAYKCQRTEPNLPLCFSGALVIGLGLNHKTLSHAAIMNLWTVLVQDVLRRRPHS